MIDVEYFVMRVCFKTYLIKSKVECKKNNAVWHKTFKFSASISLFGKANVNIFYSLNTCLWHWETRRVNSCFNDIFCPLSLRISTWNNPIKCMFTLYHLIEKFTNIDGITALFGKTIYSLMKITYRNQRERNLRNAKTFIVRPEMTRKHYLSHGE